MQNTFASLFGRRKVQPRPVRITRPRLGVEELSERGLPSAGYMTAANGSTVAASARVLVSAARTDDADSHGSRCGEASHATLAPTLSNATGATGKATISDTNGTLKASVTGVTASTELDVTVNGTAGGVLMTDASGNGTAKFTDVTANADSVVVVGDLQGTLERAKVTATLIGDTEVSGKMTFNSVKNSLHTSVDGEVAATTYNVSINGVVVGQLTTNSVGAGRLHVTPSGVTIVAGSIISITDTAGSAANLTGTFA
jgi:hypothetical protein